MHSSPSRFTLARLAPAFALACLNPTNATAAELPKNATPVLAAMRAELAHSTTAFTSQSQPPYFLSYEITENRRVSVNSSFGALMASTENTTRVLDIDLRVGSPALDNTHAIRGNFGGGGPTGSGATSIPVDDSPEAIRATLWYQTDRRFKSAVEQFTRVKTNVQVKIEEEDKSADFCAEPAHTYAEAPVTFSVDRRSLEERVRRFTAPFSAHKNIYSADASITIGVETRWYANTEGTLVQTSQPTCRIVISAVTKADDGMVLPRFETYFAFRPEQLPSDAHVLADVKKIIADLEALRTAPIVDPYTGPAILSGRAAGVFFHEVFGHRIEGHRQKRADEGQTFKKMLGQKLLPETFNVYCDPARPKYGTTELGGHYLYDNQGVKAQRVPLIESGVFTGFLMARIPIDGFPTSNGHGRKATGASVVSRQSNLIVETTKPVSPAVLKEELRKLVVAQQKPYGLLFDDIQGGFAITGRTSPNAFNVQPIMVYRIFPDGREELVRGADFIGTPLSAFSKITAADNAPDIFNGVCGAESGWVPVSAVSPSLLLSQVEVQKKEKSQERLPILSAPAGKS
ncbi:MAG: metallopeptidase TldD-related protein [Opitutaceae bacterium]